LDHASINTNYHKTRQITTMAFFAALAHASMKRTSVSKASTVARHSSTLKNASTSPPKPWFTKWAGYPPQRPMTAGEYAFLKAGKTFGLGLACTGYVGVPLYMFFYRPYPPRMLEVMSKMPPQDAARLLEAETHQPNMGWRWH
jgi:hypothetical protein